MNSLRTHELETIFLLCSCYHACLSHFGSCCFNVTQISHKYFTEHIWGSWRANTNIDNRLFYDGIFFQTCICVCVFSTRLSLLVFFVFFPLFLFLYHTFGSSHMLESFIVYVVVEYVIFRVQNFRLHPTEAHGNQSFEVHQINRMFSTSAIQSNTTNEQISSSANGHFGNSPRKTARNEHSKRKHHHHHHHHHRIRESLHEMPNDNHNCVIDVKADNCNNCHDKNSNRHSITTMESEPTHRFDNGNWWVSASLFCTFYLIHFVIPRTASSFTKEWFYFYHFIKSQTNQKKNWRKITSWIRFQQWMKNLDNICFADFYLISWKLRLRKRWNKNIDLRFDVFSILLAMFGFCVCSLT